MRIPQLIAQNKPVFGTYATMALKNVQIVLDHIQKIESLQDQMPERGPEDFWVHPVMQFFYSERYATNVDPEKADAIKERLFRNFPFLKIMAENQRDYRCNKDNKGKRGYRNNNIDSSNLEINGSDIYYVLNNMFRVLKTYRDNTMHAIIKDDKIDRNDSPFLEKNESPLSFTINNYYTVALRNVKERYSYETSDLAFIQDYRTDKRTLKTDFNFFLSMQALNGDPTGRIHLSGVGVVQLICLFLEKKYINLFLSKLPALWGGYDESSEEARVIRRSLSINSVVLPKERIHSDKRSMSTALDMINELKRCPRELFDTLSQEDQDRFRVVSSDYNEVLHVRHSDRFAQLSLQYIDSNELFKGIRFHVNMGKLRYLFSANKSCIDGGVRVRVLEQPLNGFGRLDEMEQYRRQNDTTYGDSNIVIRDFENVQRDDACAENYPYVVDTYTHYLLNNNKIEMCFSENKVVPKIEPYGGKWYVGKTIPHCRLSTLELPAMMFHMHLLGAEKTEQRIKSVYYNYKKLFTGLKEGTLTKENIDSFNICRSDMPQKVLDAVSGEDKTKRVSSYVEDTLKELLEETARLIKRFEETRKAIGSNANKQGKRNFKSISSGKLADFLAKDIVKFQPSLEKDEYYGTDRMTGLNYRVMQSSIAMYNSMGDKKAMQDFYNMFKAAKLVEDNKKSHPFLAVALKRNPKNAIEFYEQYLKARKQYLEKKIVEFNKTEHVRMFAANLPFINIERNKWASRDEDFYQILGDSYLDDSPIELPRQMFDDEIKAKLKQKPEMQDIDFDKANVTYLIGEYLKRVHNDNFQEFYDWERNYRYMDMLECKVNNKNSIEKQYLTIAEREDAWANREQGVKRYTQWANDKKLSDAKFKNMPETEYAKIVATRLSSSRNDYQKSEKHIRRYKVQDAMMFFMVKDSLTKNINFVAKDFKLQDIMPDADKGILSGIMPMDFVFEKKGKVYTISSQGMKLKNYGDFFALVNDKRMSSLLELLPTPQIGKEDIEQEFKGYDDSRVDVVSVILDFEKFVYNKYPDIKNLALQGNHFDFLDMLKELINKGDLTENEKELLRKIRNAFSHNSYPEGGIVEIRTLPEIAKHLIRVFGNSIERIQH